MELGTLRRSIDAVTPAVETARAMENAELWGKWFGQSTAESDADVRDRMGVAIELLDDMKPGYGEWDQGFWTPWCCHNTLGACNGCTDKTLAYVEAFNYSDGSVTNNKYVRICEGLMT